MSDQDRAQAAVTSSVGLPDREDVARSSAANSSPAAPGGATSEPPQSPRERWTTRISWLVIATVMYVMSPLPVGVILEFLPVRVARPTHAALSLAYRPLAWLCDRSPRVQDFYDWYESPHGV